MDEHLTSLRKGNGTELLIGSRNLRHLEPHVRTRALFFGLVLIRGSNTGFGCRDGLCTDSRVSTSFAAHRAVPLLSTCTIVSVFMPPEAESHELSLRLGITFCCCSGPEPWKFCTSRHDSTNDSSHRQRGTIFDVVA